MSLALRMSMARFDAANGPAVLSKNLDRNLSELIATPLFAAALRVHDHAEATRQELQTKVLFRAYLELLSHAGLLNQAGEPIDLAGLAGRLQASEPANIALSFLLKSAVLEQTCARFGDDRDGTSRDLLQVLSHVIAPIPIPPQRAHLYSDFDSKGVVVVPELSDAASQALELYNRQTLSVVVDILNAYVQRTQAFQEPVLPAGVLPLSHMVINADADHSAIAGVPTSLRSPFVALSGHGAEFGSAQELADSSILNISTDAIPTIELRTVSGKRMMLNAAALDFYRHGKKQSLVAENGLQESDAWQLMRNWSQVLSALMECLQAMSPAGASNQSLITTIEYLATEFDKRFKRFNC
jgi:ATP-dependent RNA helicase DDX60